MLHNFLQLMVTHYYFLTFRTDSEGAKKKPLLGATIKVLVQVQIQMGTDNLIYNTSMAAWNYIFNLRNVEFYILSTSTFIISECDMIHLTTKQSISFPHYDQYLYQPLAIVLA